ncbi:MAG: flagellar motor switch protein FliN [Deltaproteobacteria bacterium]|nr:flagellar motor switch protein FliN [Deltaproteobacteria bacterium]
MEQNESNALNEETATEGMTAQAVASDIEVGWEDGKQDAETSKFQPVKTEVTEMAFAEIKKKESVRPSLDMNFILDIPLTLNVELGRSRMLIGELLQLGQGSVIELTKLAGEPMDIYVNQRLIARGEVVVVNEKFGVRLTDIVSPTERINKLR